MRGLGVQRTLWRALQLSNEPVSTPVLVHQCHQTRHYAEHSSNDPLSTRLWEIIRGKSNNGQGKGGLAPSSGESRDLVTSDPFSKHREVFAVPLSRKPLFPGTLLPVQLRDKKLISELQQLKENNPVAYVGCFLERDVPLSPEKASKFKTWSVEVGKDRDDSFVPAANEEPSSQTKTLHDMGTFALVHTIQSTNKEGTQAMMLVAGLRRIRHKRTMATDPIRVEVDHIRKQDFDRRSDILKATSMEVISTLKELLTMHPLYNEQLRSFANVGGDFAEPDRMADMGASLTSADEDAYQAILEELDIPKRMSAVLLLLKKEVELCKLQADIGKQVEEKISKDQRRYFLMEQLKFLKRELGIEQDDKSAVTDKFRARLQEIKPHLSEAAEKVINDELTKLSNLETASSEFNVTRNYLEWLTSLPWGKQSKERLDLQLAEQVLDEDHYGLKDVKERILEFIAVGKLRGSTTGKILCLVGPPGVGKTSVGKSIARALDRSYYRFSVGGLSDIAEIKGHRRTYVGAMPGKMVQCLKSTGTNNPLVLIDEIDKLGRGWQGDPSSAMLELLDPEQNSSFLDHYLDVPVDLSNVLFMCTANVLDTIPGPLLDRMEVLRLSGYIADEKVHIARNYLEPQTRKEAGLVEGQSSLTDSALTKLITEYCREAGVRNLKKQLEKIYRKVAYKLVRSGHSRPVEDAESPESESSAESSPVADSTVSSVGEQESVTKDGSVEVEGVVEPQTLEGTKSLESIVVEEEALSDYIGQPPFARDRIYEVTPPGVVMGLAWSAQGGNSLYIEAASVEKGEGKGSLKTTGQLGDVMKESATISHTFARAFVTRLGAETLPHAPGFFGENAIHVHVPAGATPKDGPSAGCAITTALLSLALNKPVRPDLAMTGELTLTGKVLPIGGVKEKTLAARRSGITTLLFPGGNRKDYDELTDDVKDGITAHFVDHYDQVFDLAFDYNPQQVSADQPTSELEITK